METYKKSLDLIVNNSSNIDRGISIIIPTIGRESIKNLIKSIHSDSTLKKHELIIIGSSIAINKIFNLVANSLTAIALITDLSNNQINILVYYFFIPFTWLIMLDLIFEFHFLKIVFALSSPKHTIIVPIFWTAD